MDIFADKEDVIKFLFSILIGGIIGAEREYKSKSAGFRTIILICVGSTLFTIFSIQLGGKNSPDRMAANIITGIGFLGAGAIFRDLNNMTSVLTTATVIWIAAALGVGVGAGQILLSGLGCVFVMLILVGFPYLERLIDKYHQIKNYKIVFNSQSKMEQIEHLFAECKLNIRPNKHIFHDGQIKCTYNAGGRARSHEYFVEKLFLDKEIHSFEF